MVSAKKADFAKIAETFGIDPVIARIIRNRDIVGEKEIDLFLHGTLEDLHEPRLLYDMEKAVAFLLSEMEKGAALRIIGDYDIDVFAFFFLGQVLIFEKFGKAAYRGDRRFEFVREIGNEIGLERFYGAERSHHGVESAVEFVHITFFAVGEGDGKIALCDLMHRAAEVIEFFERKTVESHRQRATYDRADEHEKDREQQRAYRHRSVRGFSVEHSAVVHERKQTERDRKRDYHENEHVRHYTESDGVKLPGQAEFVRFFFFEFLIFHLFSLRL